MLQQAAASTPWNWETVAYNLSSKVIMPSSKSKAGPSPRQAKPLSWALDFKRPLKKEKKKKAQNNPIQNPSNPLNLVTIYLREN